MKLSNISVIFIIIAIPIILLLSYYISLQIDTINMKTTYTTSQLQATKEAIEAFEINTVEWNDAYSETADSKRRDVMASINTFITSFGNGLGMGGTSKENLLTYIPAIACTLYDGYYIYSPTEVKEVIKDENGVAVFMTESLNNQLDNVYEEDIGKLLYKCDGENADGTYNGEFFTFDVSNALSTYEHILKPFSTYSARYKNGDTDITVNYTLDNYITIYGIVNGVDVEKSGYLINTNSIPQFMETGENLSEKIAWREKDSNSYTCETYRYVYADDNTKVYFDNQNNAFQVGSTGIKTDLSKTTSIKYKRYRKSSSEVVYQALNNGTVKRKNDAGEVVLENIEQGKCYIDKLGTDGRFYDEIVLESDYSARNYYIESADFTQWVKSKLSGITISNMQGVEEEDLLLYGNESDKIFDIGDTDPENKDSLFVNHKNQVIKQVLISNLNQAITSYSRNSEGEYQLPILTEEDWEHIYRNVSIITFVQNIPIGLKYYNNYAVATSTQNKEFINPDEIYLMVQGDKYYHLPYCDKVINDTSSKLIGYRNIDYVVKSYDEKNTDGTTNTKYYYRHSDIANKACYYCLVQRDLRSSEELSEQELYEQDKIYKTALARERYRNILQINLNEELELKVRVDFDRNIGSASLLTPKYVAFGGKYGELYKTTRVGYNFNGWFTEPSGGSRVREDTDVTRVDNHTLYAQWSVNSYTVTFDANGGTFPNGFTTKILPGFEYDSQYGELPAGPTRDGYTFEGWYTQANGGTEIEADTIITTASDHTLYAHWSANKYTVTFNSNGGNELSSTSQEVTFNSQYGELPTGPTRDGYTFEGWYTQANGGTKIKSTTRVKIPSNHTLYAHWSANKYTVTFNSNGGNELSSTNKEVIYGSTYGELPTPTRNGYAFAGWYTEVSGGTEIKSTTKVTALGNHTLYAHWNAGQYTVTFNANGGSCDTTSKGIIYGNPYGSLPTPTRDGYTFNGWYTQASGGNLITEGAIVSTVENHTLYANWTIKTYTITYNTNGGSRAPQSQTKTHGQELILRSNRPTRDGYTFKGWATSQNTTTVEYRPGGKYKVNSSATLYAVWEMTDVTSITINQSGDQWIPIKAYNSEVNYMNLTATVYPTNAFEKGITWSSSNTKVATVDSSGKVTAVKAGTTTITATSNDNSSIKASINVYIYNAVMKFNKRKVYNEYWSSHPYYDIVDNIYLTAPDKQIIRIGFYTSDEDLTASNDNFTNGSYPGQGTRSFEILYSEKHGAILNNKRYYHVCLYVTGDTSIGVDGLFSWIDRDLVPDN